MPRSYKKTKKTKAKREEVSPEVPSESNTPQPSPKKPKSSAKKQKSSKKGNNTIKVIEEITDIKSRCSKKQNTFIGISASVDEETLADGTTRIVGVIGKSKHTIETHYYSDIKANHRILNNETIIKINYTNDKVKPIKNERYNRGSVAVKINDPELIVLTPKELRKQHLDLEMEIVTIEQLKSLENGETANLIVHVNNVSEETFQSENGPFTKTKIEIADLSDALSYLTDECKVENGDIIGLFNCFKSSRKQYTNIIGPFVMKESILNEFYPDEVNNLKENIDQICSLISAFNPDDYVSLTIRKLKQKQEQFKSEKKQLKKIYSKIKIDAVLKQIINANECTYISLKSDQKKIQQQDMKSIDEADITNRWLVKCEFTESNSKHKLNVAVFDSQFTEAFGTTANEFVQMDDEDKDEWLDSLEGSKVQLFINNEYESKEWKKKTIMSMNPKIAKIISL
eukprot:171114_1